MLDTLYETKLQWATLRALGKEVLQRDSAPASLIASCGSGFAKKIFHMLKNIGK
jgi:hypothetical protein